MRRIVRIILIAVMVTMCATPALAQEVDFRIVGFGEQDCRSGANQLNTTDAMPFTIEVCVDDGSGPANLEEVTINITHADGSVEARDKLTSGGVVRFDIVPIDAGTTTVEVCAYGTCYGTVSMHADNPPKVAEATYLGPTADLGASMPITDPEGDFWDPYEGTDAQPGLGDPAMDITRIVYRGIVNGRATYEVNTVGDVCSRLMDPATPFIQMSVTVNTPAAGEYLIGVRRQFGEEQQSASSNGVALDGTDVRLTCDANQATLTASNVDVPEGSTVAFLGWLSLESSSSGFQDWVDGPLVMAPPPDVEPLGEEPPADGSDATSDEREAAPVPVSGDAGEGSFPIWIPMVIGGVLVGGYLVYRSTRPGGAVMTTGTADVTDADLAQYVEGDLGGYTDVYGTASDTSVVGDPMLWPALLSREADIQERYLGDFEKLLSDVAGARSDYKAAIDQYTETFVKIASGSTGLQGYLQRWSENQKTAQTQDIAWGVISLVRGLGTLGWSLTKWVRGRSAARTAGNLADDAASVSTVVDDVPRPSGFDRNAAELGVDPDEWIARFRYDVTEADRVLRNAVGLQRGWHPITRNAEDVIGRLLVNGRSALGGGPAKVDPADVAKLREWASLPGFWEQLPLSAVNISYDTVAHTGAYNLPGDAVMLIYNADDIAFLKHLLGADGDINRLANSIGPARRAAMKLDVAVSGPHWEDLGVGAALTGQNLGDLSSDVMSFGEGTSLAGGLDLGSYTDQFGGWASSVDGGLDGFLTGQLHGLWGLLTSPFETFSGIAHTWGAQGRYIEFLEGHGDDLTSLGASLKSAIDALDRMADSIDDADIDDPTSSLGGGLARDLRSLLEDMEGHDGYGERRAHIEQKIADVDRIVSSLQDQLLRIRQIRDWIEGLFTDHEGNLRPVVDLWNPEILTRLGSAHMMLNAMVAAAASGGGEPLPRSAPADQAPPPADIFSEGYDPFGHLDGPDDSADDIEAELGQIFSSD